MWLGLINAQVCGGGCYPNQHIGVVLEGIVDDILYRDHKGTYSKPDDVAAI